MKLHDHEYIFQPENTGEFCWRLAVPGGWVYVFGARGRGSDREWFQEDVQGTCFVPDPYAFHVKGKGKGKGKPSKFGTVGY